MCSLVACVQGMMQHLKELSKTLWSYGKEQLDSLDLANISDPQTPFLQKSRIQYKGLTELSICWIS